MLFSSSKGRSGSFSERANMAVSSLQRNAYAMSVLRSRLESKIANALSTGNARQGPDSQELSKMLELVRNGETVLNELATKVDSARFLEEFVAILDSASASVSAITEDMEKLVPAAETALQELHDTIVRTTSTMNPSPEQEKEGEGILAEAADAAAAELRAQARNRAQKSAMDNGDNISDSRALLESGDSEPLPA